MPGPNGLFFLVKKQVIKCKPLFFMIAFTFFFINNSVGQHELCDRITKDMNYTVKSVTIAGRWVSKELQARVEQTVGVGQLFDPANVGAAMNLVKDEINKNEARFSVRLLGSIAVFYNTASSCPAEADSGRKEIAIVIRPYYLRIDLYNIGNNMLPIPRTARPTFYKNVPVFILATSPIANFINDRRSGASVKIQTQTDLMHLGSIKRTDDSSTNNQLNLNLDLQKSVTEPFYDLNGSLQFSHPVYTDKGIGWNIGLIFAKRDQPLLANENKSRHLKVFGAINGSGQRSFFKKYLAAAGVLFSENNYDLLNNRIQQDETSYNFNAVADGRIANGFTRLAIWFNASVPKNNSLLSYQRLAGQLGYAASLGAGHNVVELETIASMGYTWKTPELYNEFVAGNTAFNFLYSGLQSFTAVRFPEGPTIRSLGEKTGGIPVTSNTKLGGTSYWGLNFNISIPVRKWARPLIPDVNVAFSDDDPSPTLRSKIKNAWKQSVASIAEDLQTKDPKLSDDEATAAATRLLKKDIVPTLGYLADRANIYSVKPLVLFDVGEIYDRKLSNQLWVGAGIGLQLNVVVARLDIGYMHTLAPKVDAGKGNFLVRMAFQNFF